MINNIRTQIAIASTAVMIASAIIIIIFVNIDTARNINKLSYHSIDNISLFIEASISDNFNYFLRFKHEYVKRIKNHLKNDIEFIIKLNKYKKTEILDTVKFYVNSKSNIKFILFNEKEDSVFSTVFLPEQYKGIEQKTLSKNGKFIILSQKVNSISRSEGIGYLFKKLIEKQRFTFFVYHDIDSLDEKKDKKIKEIEKDLKEILKKIKVGNEGFSFIYKNKENKFINDGKISKKYKDDCLREIIDKSKKIYSAKEYDFLSCGRGGYTVKTSYFKGFDWYFTVVVPEYEVKKPANDLIKKLIFIIIFTISFSILLIFFLVSKVTKPLSILSKKISNVPEHDFTGDDHSELLDGLPVAAHNEAGQLARNFYFMIRELSGSIKHLVATTAAKERTESDLNAAKKIQSDVLPKDFSEPKHKDVDLYAYLNSAREIGGDLYDFFFIDEDHLCFAVGDVADKGMSAALVMFWAKKMIGSYASKKGAERLSPAEIMGEINEMLCKDNPSATFITLFIGILNVKNGEMCYANGGHVSPIFVDYGSEPKYRKDLSGVAVGVCPGIRYKNITAVLQPGGAIFLCTDGVTEAMNEKDKLFGSKRLLDHFSCMKDKSCQEVVEGILYEVGMHAGKAPQSDDIAMLMLRWGVKGEDKENHE